MSGPWTQFQPEPASGPWTQFQAASSEPSVAPTDGMSRFQKSSAGAGKALMDLVRGGKQRLNEAAVALESVFPGADAINRALGTKSAAQIKDEDQAAIAESKRLDRSLMDDAWGIGGNIGGNMVAGSLFAPLGPVGMGAAMGYTTPTTDGPGEVLQNMAVGGAAGYAGDKLVRGVSRMVQPKTNSQVRALMDEGITPTPGQILGGNAARFESKATSLPIVGDSIANAQQRAGAQLNRAAFNRALAPIGEKLPPNLQGREAVQYADDALRAAYNKLLPKLTVQADDQFASNVASLRQMVSEGALDPKYAATFDKILDTRVLGKFQGQGAMTGQTMKDAESFLGTQIVRFGKSTDPDANLVADALRELQSNLRGLVARSNPQHAKELQAINTGWANFKRVQRAAGYLGAEDGMFTPAQLQGAVKALDRSKDKARFAEGGALMQDLSDAAKSVMGPKYPDSGTAGRLSNIGALASGAISPAIPASLLLGSGLYTQPAQKAAAALLTQRPAWAPLVADELRLLGPLGGLFGSSAALSQ